MPPALETPSLEQKVRKFSVSFCKKLLGNTDIHDYRNCIATEGEFHGKISSRHSKDNTKFITHEHGTLHYTVHGNSSVFSPGMASSLDTTSTCAHRPDLCD